MNMPYDDRTPDYLTMVIDPNDPPSWVVVHNPDSDYPSTTTLAASSTEDALAEAEQLLGSKLRWVTDVEGFYDSYQRWGTGNGVWLSE